MTRVLRYCVEDAELVVDLFDEINCWISLVEMSNIVGVSVMQLYTRGQQIRGISQFYDRAYHDNLVLDGRATSVNTFAGGFVFEPKPGLYENIICFDFASLYPSIYSSG